MIDKTLVRMIDETLRETAQMPGFRLAIRADQAHLVGSPIWWPILFNARDFVRDLFTIRRFASPEGCKFRPA